MNAKFVKRGNGQAVHIAKELIREDGTVWLLAAACDGWGAVGGRVVRYLPNATEATCRTCLKSA